jgi:prepilin-type N-terminal cleavage/methylation domain-containing protein
MKLRKNNKGFTLVEIMIVVAIIGLLAAIAVPNFVQARQTARTNSCINNLRLLDAAKEQLALETNMADGAAVAAGALLDPYLKGGFANTRCPATGTSAAYTPNAIGTSPACANFNATTHAATI